MDSIERSIDKCYGCGATLHSDSEKLPGYVPHELLENIGDKRLLCKRCHRIKHYNEILKVTLEEQKFVDILKQIAEGPAFVIYVMDVFDFEGSWIDQLPKFLSKKSIYVVANKVDILPRDIKPEAITEWIEKELKKRGLVIEQVFLVSALKRWDLDPIVDSINKYQTNKDIYVIGATNVGKSTFINQLSPLLIEKEGERLFDIPEVTTSIYSGTTIETLKIPINESTAIYDTPGIVKQGRLTELICPQCLQVVTPRKRINPRIYQLNSQQTLFFGGILRFDFVAGDKQSFVCYVSNDLTIHRSKLENADELYQRQYKEILSPPCSECENTFELTQIVPIELKRNQEADIVISGLGWITIKGPGAKVVIHAPQATEISIRTALI